MPKGVHFVEVDNRTHVESLPFEFNLVEKRSDRVDTAESETSQNGIRPPRPKSAVLT